MLTALSRPGYFRIRANGCRYGRRESCEHHDGECAFIIVFPDEITPAFWLRRLRRLTNRIGPGEAEQTFEQRHAQVANRGEGKKTTPK
jgi:hypothetical protein